MLAFAVYGLVAVLGGALLHYAVERPFLQLRDRMLRPGAQPLAAADRG